MFICSLALKLVILRGLFGGKVRKFRKGGKEKAEKSCMSDRKVCIFAN